MYGLVQENLDIKILVPSPPLDSEDFQGDEWIVEMSEFSEMLKLTCSENKQNFFF